MEPLLLAAFLLLQNPAPDNPLQVPDTANPAVAEPVPTPQKEAEPPPEQTPEEVLRPAETKRLPSTGKKIATNLWSDQKELWTSPFHMRRADAKWWIIFGGATATLIATDQRTSRALPNSVRQVGFSKQVSQIGAVYTTLPVAGALYFYGRQTDNPHAREAGVLGAQSLLDSFVLVSILKFGAGRERPNVNGGYGRFFKNQRSFPSGHAMMSWSFASLIAHEYKGGKVVPIVAYSLASTVSVARFTAQQHFASDIVAGGAMGWFIGKFVFEHHLDTSIHKRYDPNSPNHFVPNIVPEINVKTHDYRLSLTWNQAGN
jgi:membrane-associated phospholipid phosphatase